MQGGNGEVSDIFGGYEHQNPTNFVSVPPGSRLAQYLHGANAQQNTRAPTNAWNNRLQPNQAMNSTGFNFSTQTSQSSNMSHFANAFGQMNLGHEKELNAPIPVSPYSFPSSSQRSLSYSNVAQALTTTPSLHDPLRPSSHINQDNSCGSTTNYMHENFGGTTYYFTPNNTNSMVGSQQNDSRNDRICVSTTGMFSYPGPLPHIARYKSSRGSAYIISEETKMEMLHRQMAVKCHIDPTVYPDVPQSVEHFQNLVPLEDIKFSTAHGDRGFFGHATTVYKALSVRDGMPYCLRRIHNFRVNPMKQISFADNWKKMLHVNVVQLKDVINTRQFGDYSVLFVYDYHPLSETIKSRHLMSRNTVQTATTFVEAATKNGPIANFTGNGPVVQETLIWSYIMQLSTALRAIHSAGMAARTIDPSKIIIFDKSKLLLSSCGVLDILSPGTDHNAVQQYQQEDLSGLGRLIVTLALGSADAARRENINNSLTFIAHQCSTDLKNIVALLLHTTPLRPRSINEVMPMIGARFFAQLESYQVKVDLLENELSREMENGRLLRLLCKLNTVVERVDYQMDASWSETGDRYLLKLLRDYLFHQVTDTGKPWIDMAHIVTTLNKLDAGVSEKIQLVSRDGDNVLIVSYTDLRHCLASAFDELSKRAYCVPSALIQ